MSWRMIFAVAVFCVLSAGCATTYKVEKARDRARIIDNPVNGWAPVSDGTNTGAAVLAGGVQNVKTLAAHLGKLAEEAKTLSGSLQAGKRGYFTVDETDRIEGLLFRYLACRETLWDIIAYYGGSDRDFGGENGETKAFVIAFNAAALLADHSSRLVLLCMKDPALIAKLNEGHHVYDIPEGSYDALLAAVTSVGNIEALRDAETLTADEAANRQSALAEVVNNELVYGELLRDAGERQKAAHASVGTILKEKALLFPKTANVIRQNPLLREAKRVTKDISDNLYVAKGLLFNSISDIKRPMSPPVSFSPEQVALIKSLLKPGDMIFTYTAGYMSNIFLPGKCKHGITYVGSPSARREAGVTPDLLADTTEGKRTRLARDLETASLPSGHDADVIEAVAEGVIFNSMDSLLKNHVNRMVVLRPRLSQEERAAALLATFLMVGCQYDFNFDFADVTYLCCTEVLYRSYHKRGGIDFALVPRFGVQTLCADDIMSYHLRQSDPKFDVILVADEEPGSKKHRARVRTGQDAASALADLMSAKAGSGR